MLRTITYQHIVLIGLLLFITPISTYAAPDELIELETDAGMADHTNEEKDEEKKWYEQSIYDTIVGWFKKDTETDGAGEGSSGDTSDPESERSAGTDGTAGNTGQSGEIPIDEDTKVKDLAQIDPMDYAKPFSPLKEETDQEFRHITASIYRTLSIIAPIGLVLSFIYAGVRLILLHFSHRPGTKEEIMSAIGTKIVVFALFCSIALVVSVLGAVIHSFT